MPPASANEQNVLALLRLAHERYWAHLRFFDALRLAASEGVIRVLDSHQTHLHDVVVNALLGADRHITTGDLDLAQTSIRIVLQNLDSSLRKCDAFPHRSPSRTALDLWEWLCRSSISPRPETAFVLSGEFEAKAVPWKQLGPSEEQLQPRIVLLSDPLRDDPVAWTALAHELGHTVFDIHCQKYASSRCPKYATFLTDRGPKRQLMFLWAEEFFCDAYAAASLGVAYFLQLSEVAIRRANVTDPEHPPLPTRLHELHRSLPEAIHGWPVIQRVVSVLTAALGVDITKCGPQTCEYSAAEVTAKRWEDLYEELKALVGVEPFSEYELIPELKQQLERGLPISTSVGSPGSDEIARINTEANRLVDAARGTPAHGRQPLREAFSKLAKRYKENPTPIPAILSTGWLRKWEIMTSPLPNPRATLQTYLPRRYEDSEQNSAWLNESRVAQVKRDQDLVRLSIQSALVFEFLRKD